MIRSPSIWLALVATAAATTSPCFAADVTPLRIVVMDPLAGPLSCACVNGVGQRRYDRLADFLKQKLQRPIELTFDESLPQARERMPGPPSLVIGKESVVRFDAERLNLVLRPLAALTDRAGLDRLTGLIVVRSDDRARTPTDLLGRTVALGPADSAEVHVAARALFHRLGQTDDDRFHTFKSIDAAVFALTDGEADAAVVSDYLPPLLEGCGKIAAGSIRTIAATEPVPFVVVFATPELNEIDGGRVATALKQAAEDPQLLDALESQRGFVAPSSVGWTDWRGPNRAGYAPTLPQQFPDDPILWTAAVTGPAMAGIAATDRHVVVADKSADFANDLFRCFEAVTGRTLWTVEYPAERRFEYTNAPRANPVIVDDVVYLFGVLGDLHCVELETGRIVWKTNVVERFAATTLNWGQCSPPLAVDGLLIVNPGANGASLAALDGRTGKTVWETAGHAAAYGALIVATLGGRRQIVGYDSASLGGWDVTTGERLWTLVPPGTSDFNVTTPLVFDDKLLLATENSATRLYAFDDAGRISAEPLAVNQDFAPDTCSPIVCCGRAFGTAYGELYCLDLADGLRTVWNKADDMFFDHSNLIAGDDRVLIWTTTGDLLLIRADGDRYDVVSHLRPFAGREVESMSHPAVVGDRLYLRSQSQLACLKLR